MSIQPGSNLYNLLRQLSKEIPAEPVAAESPAEVKRPRGRPPKVKVAEVESAAPVAVEAPKAKVAAKVAEEAPVKAKVEPKAKRQPSSFATSYGFHRKSGMSHAEAVAAAKKDCAA